MWRALPALLFFCTLLSLPPTALAARYAVQSVYDKAFRQTVDGLPANSVNLAAEDIAVDGAGNIYLLLRYSNRIVRIGGDGIVRLIGGGGSRTVAAGLQAADVNIVTARIAVDAEGSVYFGEEVVHQVFRIGQDGSLVVVAGSGTAGFSGDGGQATAASLNTPRDLSFDPAGNLYIADLGNGRVRRVARDTGTIQTIAGNGGSTSGGDDGPALSAGIIPVHLGVDSKGDLYLVEYSTMATGSIIRHVSAADGIIRRIAGDGASQAEGVQAGEAYVRGIVGFDVAPDGTLYMSLDPGEGSGQTLFRVKRVSPAGVVTTLAGGATRSISGEGGPPGAALVSSPRAIAVNAGGDIWFLDHHVVRKASGGAIQTVAGSHSPQTAGEGGPLERSLLRGIAGMVRDSQGNLYFSDTFTHSVYRATPDLLSIARIAGTGYPGYNGDSGQGLQTALYQPKGLALDSIGNVYIADQWNNRVRRLTPAGELTTLPAAPDAPWSAPGSLALDGEGNLYVAQYHGLVLRVPLGGAPQVFAGQTAGPGYDGDGGAATQALLNHPSGVAVDAQGAAYIADTDNHRIRRVAIDGTITTIAGTGESGFSGDGGPATTAKLRNPAAVQLDAAGNLLFVDSGNNKVRRISPGGIISTIAGGGTFFMNGYEATGVRLRSEPLQASLVVEPSSRLWFNDQSRLIRLDPQQLFRNWVYNCASFVNGPVAPGECIAFYGDEVGPDSLVSATYSAEGNLARSIADTQVLVNGNPVPLIFVSKDFTSALMPYGISGSAKLEVLRQGVKTNALYLTVAPTMPGLFTYAGGTGQTVAVNVENWKLNGSSEAATRGQWMTIFLTGQGAVTPAVGDGVAVTGSPSWPAPTTPVRIQVGGIEVPAGDIWAGLTYQGVLQVNFKIPESAPTGAVTVAVTMGSASSQAGTTVVLK